MADDDDVIDENQLLEDVDKEVVSVLPDNDDCENVAGRKGACKNCTCGRAEMSEKEIVETKSSCGNVRYDFFFCFIFMLIIFFFQKVLSWRCFPLFFVPISWPTCI